MSNYLTPRAEEIAKKAKELATAEGRDWNSLPREERRMFKERIVADERAAREASS